VLQIILIRSKKQLDAFANHLQVTGYAQLQSKWLFLFTMKLIFFNVVQRFSTAIQGCQIFLGTKYPNREKLPNDHKIYQMAIKYFQWL
jgi:hypothetical protein